LVAGKKAKRAKARGTRKPKRAKARSAKPSQPSTVVQLAFVDNERHSMAKKKGGKKGKLHGAALAAHRAAQKRKNPGGGAAKTNGRRRRRRNPNMTFVQALGKLAGGAAAMFGSGVLVTMGVSKIMPGSKVSAYGIPIAAALLGAGIATRYPLVGVGVGAGAAAPFVLPVAQRMLQPGGLASGGGSSTVSSLRAVAMGGRQRLGVGAVRMGAVSMGRTAHAG
jgi:hypothetical protein